MAITIRVDLMPVAGYAAKRRTEYRLFPVISCGRAGSKEDILDFELNTYCVEEPAYVGIKEDTAVFSMAG